MPGGDPIPAVASAVLLQAAHAAHDQRGLHTVPKYAPLLLPGELHLLPGSLQPPGAHPQISEASRVSGYCSAATLYGAASHAENIGHDLVVTLTGGRHIIQPCMRLCMMCNTGLQEVACKIWNRTKSWGVAYDPFWPILQTALEACII